MGGPPSGNLPGIEPGSTPSKAAPNSVHLAKMQTATVQHKAVMWGAIRDNPLTLQGAIRDNPLMKAQL